MKFSEFVKADRRWIVLFVNAPLAILLGFVTFSADESLRIMIYGGYWIMLLLVLLFVWSMGILIRQDRDEWRSIKSAPRWPAILIATCGLLLLVHETYGFKILMDEIMLLGTSMSMHFDKIALVPMRGHDILGAFEILGGELDKRPLLFPFLLSLLHDVSGYRPENSFVVNTALTYVLLVLAYRTGWRIAGRGAGAVAVLLFTSLPLLAQNAKGGGFEILNLVMILSTLLLGMRYADKRDVHSLNALCLSSVLLAMTRYESVLFIVPVALLIAWVWWQEHRPTLTWTIAFGPLLLVPYALHNRVFSVRSTSWELASRPGYEHPFALSYIPDNLAHSLNFFFSTTGEHSNSLVISILGFLALPFFVLWTVKALRHLSTMTPAKATLAIFTLGFSAHTLLLMCYFWGRFDDPVIRRLSLPLNLLLVLGIVTVATEFSSKKWSWRLLAALTGLGIFGSSLPAMARHDYTLDYYVGREMEWRRDFIASHPERDYLFIDNNCIIWVTHLVSGTPVGEALRHKENIVFNQRNRIFSAIYVFQRYAVDPATGKLSLPKEDDLGPDFHLEPYWERRFTPLTVSRISRVASIDPGPTTLPVTTVQSPVKRSAAEMEKIRLEYLSNFIKRLP